MRKTETDHHSSICGTVQTEMQGTAFCRNVVIQLLQLKTPAIEKMNESIDIGNQIK